MLLYNLWLICYEDESNTDESSASGAGATGSDEIKADEGLKFTDDQQKYLNKILAEDRRKHKEQVEKAVSEVTALRGKAALTQKERDELDHRIEELQNTLLTKEELAKKEQEKLTKTYTKQIADLTTDLQTWQQRYSESTIDRAIIDAAQSAKAIRASQVIAILKPNTRLVEVLDAEGKPTGELAPKVKFSNVDKEGKPITLELTVNEAVNQMKDMEDYLNLFQIEGAGGLGATNRGGGSTKKDVRKLAMDPEAYRKARQSGEVTFQ